ncbi:unnamed protein product [Amoebophrya sp. A120]|nr:unnamed protein product [Amoebophrya sp. A120]|eukprot:GSA120T00009639001.1
MPTCSSPASKPLRDTSLHPAGPAEQGPDETTAPGLFGIAQSNVASTCAMIARTPPQMKEDSASPTSSGISYPSLGNLAPTTWEAALLGFVAEKVQAVQDTYDGSHDFAHIVRVARLLETLLEREDAAVAGSPRGLGATAAPEGDTSSCFRPSSADEEVVQGDCRSTSRPLFSRSDLLVARLAILLHDVDDHKYAKPPGDESGKPSSSFAAKIFAETRCWEEVNVDDGILEAKTFLTPEIIDRVTFLIQHVSYSKEQKFVRAHGKEAFTEQVHAKECMLKYVQDADRIDALGALGIARCFAYGGSQARPLYSEESLFQLEEGCDSPGEVPESVRSQADRLEDGVAHFYEKLFFLKERLSTESAREMAEQRHRYMVQFLEQMREEAAGRR